MDVLKNKSYGEKEAFRSVTKIHF